MKKLFALAVLLIAAAAFAGNSITYSDANGKIVAGEVLRPGGSTDTGALRVGARTVVLYDSGIVASGVIINIPVIVTAACHNVQWVASNSDGAATRVLTARYFLADGTTSLGATAFTATPISTVGFYTIGVAASAATTNGAVSMVPSPTMSGTFAAGGTSNGRVIILCQ